MQLANYLFSVHLLKCVLSLCRELLYSSMQLRHLLYFDNNLYLLSLQAENMITHRDEIFSRPKRTWFATEKDKKLVAKSVRVIFHCVKMVCPELQVVM